MAASTRVLVSTAGPFAVYGDAIVDACVHQRTHYADITGETAWVRRLIDRLHVRAARDGTRIVPFCGFDSVPSDLGTMLVVRHIARAFGAGCIEVKGYFRMMGGFNGGTLASNAHRYETGEVKIGRNPFLLNPRTRHSASELFGAQDPAGARYDELAGTWVAPFIMGPINTRVVRRSAALNAAWRTPYGPGFRYQEYTKFGPPFAAAKATALAVAMRGFERAMERQTLRALFGTVLPKPGEGPSEETKARGWFKTDLIGRTADGRSARAHRLRRRPGQPCDRAHAVRSGARAGVRWREASGRREARRRADAGDGDRRSAGAKAAQGGARDLGRALAPSASASSACTS
jgi:short subunit dehydrogenase-like uncharacterized protein